MMPREDLWSIKKILIGYPALFDDGDFDKNKWRIILGNLLRSVRRSNLSVLAGGQPRDF